MLLYQEELARARSRQFQREAAQFQLARQARAARREQRQADRAQLYPRRALRSALRARLAQSALR